MGRSTRRVGTNRSLVELCLQRVDECLLRDSHVFGRFGVRPGDPAVWMGMRVAILSLAGVLLLVACRVPLKQQPTKDAPVPDEIVHPLAPGSPVLGLGAAPGNAKAPGRFVARGAARSFYAGPAGRLWYYMNSYYWVSSTAPREGLWIQAKVVETFRDLRTWPDGKSAKPPEPKVTVEYWEVAPSGRTVWVDNHKDYVRLADQYTAGAIEVEVTLALGAVSVKDRRGAWEKPQEPYVLESRNYRKDRGLGTDHVRFKPLQDEAVTVWRYAIPWDTHPQKLTRSNWKRLTTPSWRLAERRPPPKGPAPVVTPTSE